ncbi:ABC transporter permease subunit [Anaerocolumna sedimenticola]|uniref:ABC transporter permease subunit n=1 Tax=Anaerocolumna sedimenticola TaxID=2696063 RepID=A0A6P1TLK2_9FIRM|nr:carbohydrate ABC transporter permease [Anaerocolumna sedimenticola]QHQ60891.1 ABC transporter permease subunit [Anaerocolumna sedimenticola]
MHKFKNYSRNDKLFYIIIGFILTALFILVLYPCIFVLAASFSSGSAVQAGKVFLWPVDFSLEGYKAVFKTSSVWTGFRNSLFYTLAGTFINIFITIITAYSLARADLPGRNGIMLFFTFTMFFNGGMITTYILVKNLNMINTVWAMLIPGALGVYNMIIARTFIQSNIPLELLEAAKMDGCSDIKFLTGIVVPLSKAVIAVLVLFYGVGHWNAYFNPMIYLNTKELYPLTLFLREILMADQIDPSTIQDPELQAQLARMAGVIKYSLIVVSMVPILIIYPFIQKYFVKGVMIGSVKG